MQRRLTGAETDPYATDTHRWWHLSQPSPELVHARGSGWLATPGAVLDIGCGLGTELAFLARAGFRGAGVDLSAVAVQQARLRHPDVPFLRADALRLPFPTAAFDLVLDRGCFHYLAVHDRPAYVAEVARVLRPGGRLFLRACLCTAGERNDIDAAVVRETFEGWRWLHLSEAEIPSDTRTMPALVGLLQPPSAA